MSAGLTRLKLQAYLLGPASMSTWFSILIAAVGVGKFVALIPGVNQYLDPFHLLRDDTKISRGLGPTLERAIWVSDCDKSYTSATAARDDCILLTKQPLRDSCHFLIVPPSKFSAKLAPLILPGCRGFLPEPSIGEETSSRQIYQDAMPHMPHMPHRRIPMVG